MRRILISFATLLLLTSTVVSQQKGNLGESIKTPKDVQPISLSSLAQIGADKETLKGVTSIIVIVNPFNSGEDEEIKSLITQMQRDTEIRLRKAGIRVLNGTKERDSQKAFLNIDPHIGPLAEPLNGLYVYTVGLEIDQDISLIRNPNITRHLVPTYDVSRKTGVIGKNKLSNLRDIVADLVDTFINDYLTINPK
jgi:hypothetical protein